MGTMLNLELPLRLSDRLDGHLVTGHIDGVTAINEIRPLGAGYELSLSMPLEHAHFIAAKGSITIDGIALTVNSVSPLDFVVAIIPHSYHATNLHLRKNGDLVNFEVDIIARYAVRLVGSGAG